MNVFLWVLQGVLAFLYLTGGAYKAFRVDELVKRFPTPSRAGWRALGVLEMAGAVLLVVPAATGWRPGLSPLAAAVLAVETLALDALYAKKSRKWTVANPLAWAVPMALLAAVVAYARYAWAP